MFLFKRKPICSSSFSSNLLLAVALLFPMRLFGADQPVSQAEQPASQSVQTTPQAEQPASQPVQTAPQEEQPASQPKQIVPKARQAAPPPEPPVPPAQQSDSFDSLDAPHSRSEEH